MSVTVFDAAAITCNLNTKTYSRIGGVDTKSNITPLGDETQYIQTNTFRANLSRADEVSLQGYNNLETQMKMETRPESGLSKNTFGEECERAVLKVPAVMSPRNDMQTGSTRNNKFIKVEVKPLTTLTPSDRNNSIEKSVTTSEL